MMTIKDLYIKPKIYFSWKETDDIIIDYFKALKGVNIELSYVNRCDFDDVTIDIIVDSQEDLDKFKGYLEYLENKFGVAKHSSIVEEYIENNYGLNVSASFLLLADILQNIDKRLVLEFIEPSNEGLGLVCEQYYEIPKTLKDNNKYSQVIYERIIELENYFHEFLIRKDIDATIDIKTIYDPMEDWLDKTINIYYKDIEKLIKLINDNKVDNYYYSDMPYEIINIDENEIDEDFDEEVSIELEESYFYVLFNIMLSELYGHKIVTNGIFYEDEKCIRIEFDFSEDKK